VSSNDGWHRTGWSLLTALLVYTAGCKYSPDPFQVPVSSWRAVATEELNELNQALREVTVEETAANPEIALRHLWGDRPLIGIDSATANPDATGTRRAVIISLEGDDSVGSSRSDVELVVKDGHWHITQMIESWRCVRGRGHQDFSTAACT
jgi:hypothetical protein